MSAKLEVLQTLDYIVIAMVLGICAGIGLYYRFTGGKQTTVEEFLLGDKNMPIIPVAFSLMASFMSAVTIMGDISEIYYRGTQYLIINVAYGLCTPIVAYLYLPVFFRLQKISAYGYLELRFGKVTRLLASTAYTVQMVLYMGIVLFAPALSLEALTGINQTTAILCLGLVCTFYSTLGGLKAVVMTDVIQVLLMFTAVFSVIISARIQTGSFDEIWKIANDGKRIEFFNFNPDPTIRHTWFSLLLGGSVTFLSLFAVNQTQVQRYLSVKDLKQAQLAVWLNWPLLSGLGLATTFSGLAIYTKYHNCDPLLSNGINSADQLMPYYVIDTMGHLPGLSGLFVAGLFSGSLSTISSLLNSLAAVSMEDHIKPLYINLQGREIPNEKLTFQTKLLTIGYGLLCIAVAFLAKSLGGILQAALTIIGVIGGSLLGLFSLGMFGPSANEKGALVGVITGLALSMWIAFGGPKQPTVNLPVSTEGCNSTLIKNLNFSNEERDYFWLYRISYLYIGPVGLLVTVVVGFVFSFIILKLFKEKSKNLDSNLFIFPISKNVENRKENIEDVSSVEVTSTLMPQANVYTKICWIYPVYSDILSFSQFCITFLFVLLKKDFP